MGVILSKEHVKEISVAEAGKYDHILLIDQSGSMGEPSTSMPGRSRWQEVAEFATSYARFAEQVDEDGITVITFNSGATVFDGVTADKVKEIFANNRPGGSTNLAAALREAFKKKFSSEKPAIIMCFTDGIPDDEAAVVQEIVGAANKINRDEELAVSFIQIGDNQDAGRFLKRLDDQLKDAKFDIVDARTREEAEGLAVEQLIWLAIND